MTVPINTSCLEDLRYTLYTSAKTLCYVWNDKQYDYFLQHYVRPVTDDVQIAIDRLNEQIVTLRIAVEELESLAENY